MKQKDITKLNNLANLAQCLIHIGEDAAAETIRQHISHTIAEIFERTSDGKSSSSTPV